MFNSAIISSFSASYLEAREKFLKACEKRSLKVDSRFNPHAKGFHDEALYTDIVQIGPEKASKVLLLLSGTHGVEGYCGSGVQIALLNEGYLDDLPADVSVIMVHAMNPYGFSHDRRVTEDNVDLNRNFIDFAQPDLPGKDYAAFHKFILPNNWTGPARDYADSQIASLMVEHGQMAVQTAITSGQYHYPDGIFYGGHAPTWSSEMFRTTLSDYLTDKSVVGTIDFHTGLGPHGYGELIAIGSKNQKKQAAKWYNGDVTDPEAGTSTSADLDGMVAHCIAETLTTAQLTFVTLEFGTFDTNRVLNALRGDNWLYQKGNVETELGKNIKQDMRKTYYPDTDAWKLSVWDRSRDVILMALDGLKHTPCSIGSSPTRSP